MDFNKIIENVLLAILPLLAAQLTAYLFSQFRAQMARLDDRKQRAIYDVISTAIRSAEQIYKSGNGEQKKAYAIDYIEKQLKAKGINIDLDVIEAEIEAQVFSELQPTEPLG